MVFRYTLHIERERERGEGYRCEQQTGVRKINGERIGGGRDIASLIIIIKYH